MKDERWSRPQNPPFIPVSWGEVFDKYTILNIKKERLVKPEQLKNVCEELEELGQILENLQQVSLFLQSMLAQLEQVNIDLWEIEDKIREREKLQLFDEEFIRLARSVYHKNDKRAKIKRSINDYLGSKIVEEKQYFSYN